VNVTPVPEQMVVAEAETATEGVTVVLMVATQGTRDREQPEPCTVQLKYEGYTVEPELLPVMLTIPASVYG